MGGAPHAPHLRTYASGWRSGHRPWAISLNHPRPGADPFGMATEHHVPTQGPYGALAARLQAAQLVREAEEATAKAAAEEAAEEPVAAKGA